jgi:hypothetical protein
MDFLPTAGMRIIRSALMCKRMMKQQTVISAYLTNIRRNSLGKTD